MYQAPQLPTELICHIIKLSVPECTFATFAERAAILRSCCLVSRTWCSIARPFLLTSIVLKGQSSVDKFLSCTANLEPEHLLGVKQLRVLASYGTDALTNYTLTALFRRLSNLSYFNLNGACWSCLDIPLLLHLQQCQTLVLNGVDLDTTLYGPLCFPNLRELSLCRTLYRGATPLFSPFTVPNLQCIALEAGFGDSRPTGVCWSLLAQVKVLTLSAELWNRFTENSIVLPSAHTVIIKQYSTQFLEWVALSAPHLITHLLLSYTPVISYSGLSADTLWENIDLLKRKIAPLTSLKLLCFSQRHVYPPYNVTVTCHSDALLSVITNFCTDRGIIVFTKELGGDFSKDGVESMVPHWILRYQLTEQEDPLDYDNRPMEIG